MAAQVKLRCGVAVASEALRTRDALIEAARAAMHRASDEAPLCIVDGRSASSSDDGGALPPGIIAESAAMKKLFATIERLADMAIPVLIQGETGTGKEIVARALHQAGHRREGKLVAINCGAIPNQLIENTLFGHEKGAITGATDQSAGIFESADAGAVFLDEVGELPAQAQATLLRVLETKRLSRVGSSEELEDDLRVVAATHRDLEQMVDEGSFRADGC